ncbi:MAG: quinone-dependent dihydroorotate dehydrogenase, partial [Chitinophagaceae bacterium]|nr:quinone-dependent dihydroorotate dehydrogenase [Chitinophagaceae bacterium]
MYKFLRNFLFLFDAEQVHYFSMNLLKLVCKASVLKKIITHQYTPPDCPVNVFGITFKNPVGLGAGFDKNAKYLTELEALGFGFVEIGTVTPLPQKGNDKPRLFRLTKDKALINRMGFNNDGAKVVTERLKEWKEKGGQWSMVNGQLNPQLIIGGNIGKNKTTPNEDAWKDYEICFLELFDWVDYFVVNVSSPNTPGLRELQQKDSLRKILTHLQDLNGQKKNTKPILLKISPDLILEEIDDIIDLSTEINLDGLIVANTTIKRDQLQTPSDQFIRAGTNQELQIIGAGGLSGKPLKQSSTQLVEYICKKTNNKIPIIA